MAIKRKKGFKEWCCTVFVLLFKLWKCDKRLGVSKHCIHTKRNLYWYIYGRIKGFNGYSGSRQFSMLQKKKTVSGKRIKIYKKNSTECDLRLVKLQTLFFYTVYKFYFTLYWDMYVNLLGNYLWPIRLVGDVIQNTEILFPKYFRGNKWNISSKSFFCNNMVLVA